MANMCALKFEMSFKMKTVRGEMFPVAALEGKKEGNIEEQEKKHFDISKGSSTSLVLPRKSVNGR